MPKYPTFIKKYGIEAQQGFKYANTSFSDLKAPQKFFHLETKWLDGEKELEFWTRQKLESHLH